MTTLVVGATGATGRLLVQELRDRGQDVRVIVRTPDKLPEALRNDAKVTVIHASLLQLSDAELSQYVGGCSAVASCLGHTLNLKGMFGRPRLLVTDATRRLCDAIKANKAEDPTKFVLMNTAGNSNRDLQEPVSLAQRLLVGLLRSLLPPQMDNEKAADYLRIEVGRHHGAIEWAAVRPDTLIDEGQVTPYEVHPSPTRSAIFDPGKTSRINVAHFMAKLITDEDTWRQWKGQMPVIYSKM